MKFLIICFLALLINGCANKIEGQGNTIHNENVQNPNLNLPLSSGLDTFGSSRVDTKSNLNISYFKDRK